MNKNVDTPTVPDFQQNLQHMEKKVTEATTIKNYD